MSNARTKKYNRNRYRKVYQPVRALPAWGIRSDKKVVLESLRVKFSGGDSVTFSLEGRYAALPGIVVTPVGELADVNVFITSISLASVPDAGGKEVTISLGASVAFEGEVFVQALMIA